MSRDAYVGGSRSPRGVRLPTVDRSPSRAYPGGSPLGVARKPLTQTRSGNNSPEHRGGYGTATRYASYYGDEDLGSPMLEDRGRPMTVGPGHHRSRSATRPSNPMSVRYQSLDRGPTVDHEREFLPIRDRRDRSLERGLYFEDDPYLSSRSARQSPTSHQPFIGELQHQNSDLQRDLANLKKELEMTNQKLGSSMHSIKTFWSPELKKERALRKEESAKYSLINDQLKLLSSENQKQAMLVRQLEEELRMRMRGPSIEMQQQMEALIQENEHLQREIVILRDTIKELELRIETQKQTLQARDESIKKLLEMLQNKGMGKEEERAMFQQMQAMAQKQLDEFRVEIQRRDQEILAMGAKMKTLEEQHQDYQRHIAVLKESLCAKEEHYNMLQTDCEELRARLEEKNRIIEKKQQQHQQERARAGGEIAEMREHMDIKDRKINVLQRKLELHEATKKLQMAGQPRVNGDISAQKQQLDAERKKVEDLKRQVDEQKKAVDNKSRQTEERERKLADLEKQLEKRKQQMDQLEASLQKVGGNAAAVSELNKKLAQAEEAAKKAEDEVKRSAAEMERLLQLVQMSQEEQNAKEKQIMELQQALKNAQAKLKQVQQQAQAAKEEMSNDSMQLDDRASQVNKDKNIIHLDLEEELDRRKSFILELEESLNASKIILLERENEIKILKLQLREKNTAIKEMEINLTNLGKSTNGTNNNNSNLDNIHISVENVDDLEDLIVEKDGRIMELEDALRDTIRISTERETVLQQEEAKRKQILEKVAKLEQRLLSLQAAQAMRCHNCRTYVNRMISLEAKLKKMISERRKHLQELTHMKRDAIEAAISEKDAHLALLEMTGIRNVRQADEADCLRLERRSLVELLKKEAERSISLLEEISEEDELPVCLISNEDLVNNKT